MWGGPNENKTGPKNLWKKYWRKCDTFSYPFCMCVHFCESLTSACGLPINCQVVKYAGFNIRSWGKNNTSGTSGKIYPALLNKCYWGWAWFECLNIELKTIIASVFSASSKLFTFRKICIVENHAALATSSSRSDTTITRIIFDSEQKV